jgi:hypothetical protein
VRRLGYGVGAARERDDRWGIRASEQVTHHPRADPS